MKNYNVRLFRELEFQFGKWDQKWDNGRVVYRATKDNAEVRIVQPGGIEEHRKFPTGSEIWVCYDSIHLPPSMDPALEEQVSYRDLNL